MQFGVVTSEGTVSGREWIGKGHLGEVIAWSGRADGSVQGNAHQQSSQ